MKGDFTRSTFQPQKHYTGVRMQQGRLQLDADWNEQVDIQAHLNQIQLQDIIGISGVPKKNGGFNIKTTDDSKELIIGAGHIYVNGILCELEQDVNYNQQPDYPNALQTDLKGSVEKGDYIVYLDVWQRHITAIEDPEIRETALVNVPDTATRTKTVSQVKLHSKGKSPEDYLNSREVYLTANVKSISGLNSAIASDQGLENHLYRVEIHQASNGNQPATFKWSRDNGSIVSAITGIKENTIIIQNFGRDDLQSFAAGQWVEVTDEVRELQNRPGTLVRLSAATSGRQLTFDPDTVDGDSITKDNFDFERHKVKVRRWDNNSNTGQATIAINPGEWISLEAGIEVKFEENNSYKTGDYWQLPVRSEQRIDQIPWSGKRQSAQGIKHYYCQLAQVKFNGTNFEEPEDKRPKFESLTEHLAHLNNKLDKDGVILTGSLGVGLVSDATPQARLQIYGEHPNTMNRSTIASQNGSTENIETEGLEVGQLKAGDIIIVGSQKTAIANTQDIAGTFTVKPAFSSVILPGTTFSYQRPIALFTSNDNKAQLIINALGNVGIGTFTPTEKLEVVGKVKITKDGIFDQNLTVGGRITTANLNVTGTFQADTFTGNHLQISGDSNFGSSLAIANNLNVNAKTTTANLEVTNTVQAGTLQGNNLQIHSNGDIGGSLEIANALNVTNRITTANLDVTGTSQADIFTGNRFQINGDSNIGGSLAIANNLNVNAKTTTANLEVTNTVQAGTLQGNNLQIHSNGNIGGSLAIANALNVTNRITTANLDVTGTSQADTFTGNRFQINGDSNIGGSLAIANNLNVNAKTTTANLEVTDTSQITNLQANNLQITGNVGIGIARPLARLHNQGAASLPGQDQIFSNATTVTGTSFNQYLNIGDIIAVTNGTTSQSRLITDIAANGNSLTVNAAFVPALPATGTTFTYQQPITRLADSSGVTQVIVTATGSVGIGTSRPDLDTKLHIQGNVRVYGRLFQDSSIELKDNITELSQQEVHEILKGLNPVKYSYKDDTEQRLHLGFIAENLPDVLASPDKTAVQPFNILAVLAKAVQDQQTAIATLTNLVKEQQKQIVALREKTKSLDEKSWWG